jgi:hypothetical protein
MWKANFTNVAMTTHKNISIFLIIKMLKYINYHHGDKVSFFNIFETLSSAYWNHPVHSSAYPYACNNFRMTEQISIKFNIGKFYWNLSKHSSFGWNWMTIVGNLREYLRDFLSMEVIGWKSLLLGSPARDFPAIQTTWGESSSFSQTGAHLYLLIPEISGITGAIHKC